MAHSIVRQGPQGHISLKMLVEDWSMASTAQVRSEDDERDRRIKRNRRAIALLRKWRKADDDEQRETWELLKQRLDEDRLSGRRLFPSS
jgi:hypothetical protein